MFLYDGDVSRVTQYIGMGIYEASGVFLDIPYVPDANVRVTHDGSFFGCVRPVLGGGDQLSCFMRRFCATPFVKNKNQASPTKYRILTKSASPTHPKDI